MNDNLQNQLAGIIGQLQLLVSKTGDFAIQQLPDVAAQYLLYGRAQAIASLFFFFIGTLLSAAGVVVSVKKINDGNEDYFQALMIFTITGVVSAAGFIASIKGALFVFLAPKVWLIQSFADLLHG